jgi:hypothetical protein
MPKWVKGQSGNPAAKWKKGTSGNKSGHSKEYFELAAAAREYTKEALEVIAVIMRAEKAPYSVRLAAALALHDRGHGKAPQQLNIQNVSPLAELNREELDELREAIRRERLTRAGTGSGPGASAPLRNNQLN